MTKFSGTFSALLCRLLW